MSRIIGIDLGTTFSVAAFMAEDGPKLIPNELGESLTPSVVGIDQNGEILVGKSAKELQVTQPDRCASVFKRYMGTDWTTVLNGRVFTPEKLSSLVLMSLKRDAESHFGESIDQAVITVPAYFNEHQRKATIRAGEIAGLKVQRILNEPTAAAIAYGLHSSKDEQNFAVLDLGGGTFDISVVELFEGALEVKASSGETFLGGVDFTNCLAARVLERQGLVFEQVETKSPKLISRLFQECEQAKRRLSKQSNVSIRVPDENGEFHDKSPRVDVSCDEFEEWTSRILKRIESPIRRALGDARIKREEVDELILVGGATRMPAVVRRVAEIFGQQPICRLNPDEVVALGAAVQASLFTRDASVDDLVVTDVAPFTLGIESTRSVAGEYQDGYFLPIISRNTTIPTSRVERVGTLYPNQTLVNVRVFQGEARRTVDNLFLGEFAVDGIPRGAAGQAVDIRFTYDLNGILEIEATIMATSKKITHIIARHAKGLSPEEIARAVSEMTALKFHPREESVNRYLVRRAERIYQELPTDGRRFLDSLLSGFEEALEYRDPSAIESNRSLLEQFLNQFDSEEPNEEEFEGG